MRFLLHHLANSVLHSKEWTTRINGLLKNQQRGLPKHRGWFNTIVFSKASTDSSAILFWPQNIPALLTIL